MTPQERQLIAELFDALQRWRNPRDPGRRGDDPRRTAPRAERRLCAGADRAGAGRGAQGRERPHPGLRAASRRRRSSRTNRRAASSIRCATAIFGRDEPRGSVPRVPPGGRAALPVRADAVGPAASGLSAGLPAGLSGRRADAGPDGWRRLVPRHRCGCCRRHDRRLAADGWYPLGTRRPSGGPFSGALDSLHGGETAPCQAADAAGSDLSRDAGLDDIAGGRGIGGSTGAAGLFDNSDNDNDDDADDSGDDGDDGGFDDGDSDTA